ncbi:MAG: hypothetical protein K6G64_03660 [Eubacterium sp.]|nr:hypothetical protein [Eubacterium sp.]
MNKKKIIVLTIIICFCVLFVYLRYKYLPASIKDKGTIAYLIMTERKDISKYTYEEYKEIKSFALPYVSEVDTLEDLKKCKNLEMLAIGILPVESDFHPIHSQSRTNSRDEKALDEWYKGDNKEYFKNSDERVRESKRELKEIISATPSIHTIKLGYHFLEEGLYDDLSYLTPYEKQISELWLVSFYKLDLESIKKFNHLSKLMIIDAQFSEKEAEKLIEQLSTQKTLKELYLFGDSFKNAKNIGKLSQLDTLEIAYTDAVKNKEKTTKLKELLPSTEITVRNIEGSLK